MNRLISRLGVMVFTVSLQGFALADNAALTTGGMPRMMKGHPTIEMASETVKLTVYDTHIDADCSFTFVNHGKACQVFMGFPDFGLFAYAQPRQKPETMLGSFQSYVDGKPVKTKLVLGAKNGEQWQTKTVPFHANGTRIVRETYTTILGGAMLSKTDIWTMASYVLHTGASWKGNIGKATVMVTFAPSSEVTGPLDLLFTKPFANGDPKIISAQLKKPGGIVAWGVAKPTVKGQSLTFVKTNWRPTEKDDIFVIYHFPSKVAAAQQAELDKDSKKGKPR